MKCTDMDLIEGFADNLLTCNELLELNELVKLDSSVADALADLLYMQGIIRASVDSETRTTALNDAVMQAMQAISSSNSNENAIIHAIKKRQSKRIFFRTGLRLAVAAGVLVAFGMWWLGGGTQIIGNRQVDVVARVKVVNGVVSVLHHQGSAGLADSADREIVKVGYELREGDRIEVGLASPEEMVLLTWIDSSSSSSFALVRATLKLGAGSVLTVPFSSVTSPNGSTCRLEKGSLNAEVAKQSVDRPFRIETPHALVEVLGTRFRLNAHGTALDGSSSLTVEKGLVRFVKLKDGESVYVAAGRFALASAGRKLVAMAQFATQLPAGYKLGPIVFEDDFVDGLENWDLLAGNDISNLLLEGSDPSEIQGMAQFQDLSYYFAPDFPSNIKDRTHAVSLRSSQSDSMSTVCIRSKSSVVEDAFSIVFFMAHIHAQGLYATPFPTARVVDELVNAKTKLPSVFIMRWDCIPAGQDKDGTPLLQVRRYISSTRREELNEEKLCNTQTIAWKDKRVSLVFSAGYCELARVEVRKLEKK